MVIRRLRLNGSDDDEDDAVLAPTPPHLETETDLPTQQQTASDLPRSSNAEPLEISDDDFIDVSDGPMPTSPPRYQNPGPQEIPPSSSSNSGADPGCPISDSLRRLGLSLRREWLDACVRELESYVRGFPGFDVTTKAKLCFEQFLFSDMNNCGIGVLPANVDSMHLVDLPGPYVLQVRFCHRGASFSIFNFLQNRTNCLLLSTSKLLQFASKLGEKTMLCAFQVMFIHLLFLN